MLEPAEGGRWAHRGHLAGGLGMATPGVSSRSAEGASAGPWDEGTPIQEVLPQTETRRHRHPAQVCPLAGCPSLTVGSAPGSRPGDLRTPELLSAEGT